MKLGRGKGKMMFLRPCRVVGISKFVFHDPTSTKLLFPSLCDILTPELIFHGGMETDESISDRMWQMGKLYRLVSGYNQTTSSGALWKKHKFRLSTFYPKT